MSKRKRDSPSTSSTETTSGSDGAIWSDNNDTSNAADSDSSIGSYGGTSISSETSGSASKVDSSDSAEAFSGSSGSWADAAESDDSANQASTSGDAELLDSVSSSSSSTESDADNQQFRLIDDATISSGSPTDSSEDEEDKANVEGFPYPQDDKDLIPKRWYIPMVNDLLDIANYYHDWLTFSYSGHSGGVEQLRHVWRKCRSYVNAMAPPEVHKSVEQCKRKLNSLKTKAKDKTQEFTRRINKTGSGPVKPKYMLSATLKKANDYAGEDAVIGIPGTRESRIYARGSEKARRYNEWKIYKYNRKSRPNYRAIVQAERKKRKVDAEAAAAAAAVAAEEEEEEEDADDEGEEDEAEPAARAVKPKPKPKAKAKGKGKGKGKNGNRKCHPHC